MLNKNIIKVAVFVLVVSVGMPMVAADTKGNSTANYHAVRKEIQDNKHLIGPLNSYGLDDIKKFEKEIELHEKLEKEYGLLDSGNQGIVFKNQENSRRRKAALEKRLEELKKQKTEKEAQAQKEWQKMQEALAPIMQGLQQQQEQEERVRIAVKKAEEQKKEKERLEQKEKEKAEKEFQARINGEQAEMRRLSEVLARSYKELSRDSLNIEKLQNWVNNYNKYKNEFRDFSEQSKAETKSFFNKFDKEFEENNFVLTTLLKSRAKEAEENKRRKTFSEQQERQRPARGLATKITGAARTMEFVDSKKNAQRILNQKRAFDEEYENLTEDDKKGMEQLVQNVENAVSQANAVLSHSTEKTKKEAPRRRKERVRLTPLNSAQGQRPPTPRISRSEGVTPTSEQEGQIFRQLQRTGQDQEFGGRTPAAQQGSVPREQVPGLFKEPEHKKKPRTMKGVGASAMPLSPAPAPQVRSQKNKGFGSLEQVNAALGEINALHQRIKGGYEPLTESNVQKLEKKWKQVENTPKSVFLASLLNKKLFLIEKKDHEQNIEKLRARLNDSNRKKQALEDRKLREYRNLVTSTPTKESSKNDINKYRSDLESVFKSLSVENKRKTIKQHEDILHYLKQLEKVERPAFLKEQKEKVASASAAELEKKQSKKEKKESKERERKERERKERERKERERKETAPVFEKQKNKKALDDYRAKEQELLNASEELKAAETQYLESATEENRKALVEQVDRYKLQLEAAGKLYSNLDPGQKISAKLQHRAIERYKENADKLLRDYSPKAIAFKQAEDSLAKTLEILQEQAGLLKEDILAGELTEAINEFYKVQPLKGRMSQVAQNAEKKRDQWVAKAVTSKSFRGKNLDRLSKEELLKYRKSLKPSDPRYSFELARIEKALGEKYPADYEENPRRVQFGKLSDEITNTLKKVYDEKKQLNDQEYEALINQSEQLSQAYNSFDEADKHFFARTYQDTGQLIRKVQEKHDAKRQVLQVEESGNQPLLLPRAEELPKTSYIPTASQAAGAIGVGAVAGLGATKLIYDKPSMEDVKSVLPELPNLPTTENLAAYVPSMPTVQMPGIEAVKGVLPELPDLSTTEDLAAYNPLTGAGAGLEEVLPGMPSIPTVQMPGMEDVKSVLPELPNLPTTENLAAYVPSMPTVQMPSMEAVKGVLPELPDLPTTENLAAYNPLTGAGAGLEEVLQGMPSIPTVQMPGMEDVKSVFPELPNLPTTENLAAYVPSMPTVQMPGMEDIKSVLPELPDLSTTEDLAAYVPSMPTVQMPGMEDIKSVLPGLPDLSTTENLAAYVPSMPTVQMPGIEAVKGVLPELPDLSTTEDLAAYNPLTGAGAGLEEVLPGMPSIPTVQMPGIEAVKGVLPELPSVQIPSMLEWLPDQEPMMIKDIKLSDAQKASQERAPSVKKKTVKDMYKDDFDKLYKPSGQSAAHFINIAKVGTQQKDVTPLVVDSTMGQIPGLSPSLEPTSSVGSVPTPSPMPTPSPDLGDFVEPTFTSLDSDFAFSDKKKASLEPSQKQKSFLDQLTQQVEDWQNIDSQLTAEKFATDFGRGTGYTKVASVLPQSTIADAFAEQLMASSKLPQSIMADKPSTALSVISEDAPETIGTARYPYEGAPVEVREKIPSTALSVISEGAPETIGTARYPYEGAPVEVREKIPSTVLSVISEGAPEVEPTPMKFTFEPKTISREEFLRLQGKRSKINKIDFSDFFGSEAPLKSDQTKREFKFEYPQTTMADKPSTAFLTSEFDPPTINREELEDRYREKDLGEFLPKINSKKVLPRYSFKQLLPQSTMKVEQQSTMADKPSETFQPLVLRPAPEVEIEPTPSPAPIYDGIDDSQDLSDTLYAMFEEKGIKPDAYYKDHLLDGFSRSAFRREGSEGLTENRVNQLFSGLLKDYDRTQKEFQKIQDTMAGKQPPASPSALSYLGDMAQNPYVWLSLAAAAATAGTGKVIYDAYQTPELMKEYPLSGKALAQKVEVATPEGSRSANIVENYLPIGEVLPSTVLIRTNPTLHLAGEDVARKMAHEKGLRFVHIDRDKLVSDKGLELLSPLMKEVKNHAITRPSLLYVDDYVSLPANVKNKFEHLKDQDDPHNPTFIIAGSSAQEIPQIDENVHIINLDNVHRDTREDMLRSLLGDEADPRVIKAIEKELKGLLPPSKVREYYRRHRQSAIMPIEVMPTIYAVGQIAALPQAS